ncbi:MULTISPECIES: DUF6565 domain-containing protein [unclassified Flavobacterium]|uniref:DUF6565 domain-containing protein n=1 Tax=unclassified Flavobacterium TaxID=196869 RepID=UPI000F0D0A87|nr:MULTISPECIES: DUF6565 domain-containing protein [unclassified Flavobacterium]AYN02969.1 hypothetical protein EAG11_01390 [Flavobacterium sp. 140616W15]MCD0473201.1 hypothetical protein [Flavobacterium sp. EDS]
MKNTQLLFGLAFVAMGFVSCKDEKAAQAEKTIDSYVVYVDSIKNVTAENAKTNWKAIESGYATRVEKAEMALADIKENAKAQERLESSKAKYEAFKAEMAALNAPSKMQKMRDALFGEGKIGEDMNFDWVNAKNIHSVYQQFVHTVENNKDSYSREDWDKIKMMYEALDSRKNTVEKEGLSSEDNRKIAGLKLKFAPMYTLNRMGAKSEETAKAKE